MWDEYPAHDLGEEEGVKKAAAASSHMFMFMVMVASGKSLLPLCPR